MKHFKKITKTDKSICVSSRVKYIFERIKTYDELFYFIQNVITNNVHDELIGGRSIISLIAPLSNPSQSRKQFNGFIQTNKVYIDLKDYGIRVVADKHYCVTLGNIFNKIFKVSSVSVLENGQFGFVIKHAPSTGKELEFSDKEKNDIESVRIKEEQISLDAEKNRLEQERRMLNSEFFRKLEEIDSKLNSVKVKISKNNTKLESFKLRLY